MAGKFFRRFPTPIYRVPGRSSNNNPIRIYIGEDHPHPAAVTAQEMGEQRQMWHWHVFPALIYIPALGFLAAHFYPEFTDEIIGAVMVLSGFAIGSYRIPAEARRIGLRGQIIEAVAAVWLYGRNLEDEVTTAARQVMGSNYAGKYGLKGKQLYHVQAMADEMIPSARDYVVAHKKEIADAYRWLHDKEPPPFRML